MTISAITSATAAGTGASQKAGFGSLGQKDFLRLLTTQMQAQDPFQPVDNKEMLAQMAQFSSLAGISDVNETLKSIAKKLDAVLGAQAAAPAVATSTTSTTTTTTPAS